MKLSDFDYSLPKGLIAQYPVIKRDAARLMVVDRAKGSIEHRLFKDILDYLEEDDTLVLNDTKVMRARLLGRKKTGGKVDILLLEKRNAADFTALIRPQDMRINEKIIFDEGSLEATLIDKGLVRFNTQDSDYIYSKGLMPLPPYIKRLPEKSDGIYYQTVFAKSKGAVASPTAGLHFTEGLLSTIKKKGINLAYITLHINYATFKPVKEQDILRHKMYREYFEVKKAVLGLIDKTKKENKKLFAVGTTTCRAVETAAGLSKERLRSFVKYKGWTDLYIYPGYKFKTVACLITNFHLPRTTLFILVCAFAGRDLMFKVYQEAIDKKYRFYSYGDAMLII